MRHGRPAGGTGVRNGCGRGHVLWAVCRAGVRGRNLGIVYCRNDAAAALVLSARAPRRRRAISDLLRGANRRSKVGIGKM